MPNQAKKFLTQDVDQLLENPEFRVWARRSDAVVPEGAGNVRQARMILLGLSAGDGMELPTRSHKEVDFAALMAKTREIATPTTPVRRLWPGVMLVAATVLLLLTAGIFFLGNLMSAAPVYATGNAEQLEVKLADGTTVTLNANSSLRLPDGGWTIDERSVSLEGEAFFDVVRDASRPFLVKTDDASIRVVGTRFNVRERRGSTRIYLEEGEVKVGWPGTQYPDTRLLPNELVTLAGRGKQPVHVPAKKPGRHLAWKSGHLEFDRLPLVEALNELGDIYGIELSCADADLEKLEISSAGIPVDDLKLALRLMGKALGLQIEARESSVYIVFAAE